MAAFKFVLGEGALIQILRYICCVGLGIQLCRILLRAVEASVFGPDMDRTALNVAHTALQWVTGGAGLLQPAFRLAGYALYGSCEYSTGKALHPTCHRLGKKILRLRLSSRRQTESLPTQRAGKGKSKKIHSASPISSSEIRIRI